MPEGKPNAQTIATQKYQKKIGLISKSFKIKKELAEEFKEACERKGVGQVATISQLMEQFISSVEKTKE